MRFKIFRNPAIFKQVYSTYLILENKNQGNLSINKILIEIYFRRNRNKKLDLKEIL